MCFASTPDLPEAPPQVPRLADAGVRLARSQETSRRRASAGRRSTILTGGGGLTGQASTTSNVLLGT